MLDHTKFPEIYKECEVSDDIFGIKYCFQGEKNPDYMEVVVSNSKPITYMYYIDNFPGQKKYFKSSVPYLILSDFERDVERMGLPKLRKL